MELNHSGIVHEEGSCGFHGVVVVVVVEVVVVVVVEVVKVVVVVVLAVVVGFAVLLVVGFGGGSLKPFPSKNNILKKHYQFLKISSKMSYLQHN